MRKEKSKKPADVYHRARMKSISFRLHNEHDAEIIEYISAKKNKAAWFRDMIRADMKKNED